MKQGNPAHFDAKAVFSGTFTNSEVINQIVHNHPAEDSAPKFWHWLSAIQFDKRHNEIRTRKTRDTARWILNHRDFKSWQSSKGAFLWLNGSIGTGKSVLTSEVVEELKPRSTVAYFYCDFTLAETLKEIPIFRSLLSQLLLKSRNISGIEDLIEDLRKRFFATREDIYWTGLKEFILKTSKLCSGITIIIDGLDECKDQEIAQFIDHVGELCQESNVKGSQGPIRLFLSCRPVKNIAIHLANNLKGLRSISLEKEIEFVSEDIRKYVQNEFKFTTFSEETKHAVWKKFETKGVMFQLVQYQMKAIRDCENEKEVQNAVRQFPTELQGEYERSLRNLKETHTPTQTKRAKQVFIWLTTAKRPLRVAELREALGFDEQTTCLEHVERASNFLPFIRACDSFINCRKGATSLDDEISLSHFSVKEFFLSANPFPDDIADFRFSKLDAEKRLATMTLSYLVFDNFDQRPCTTAESFAKRLQSAQLLAYSARHWTDHVYSVMDEVDNSTVEMDVTTPENKQAGGSGYRLSRLLQAAIGYFGWLSKGHIDDVIDRDEHQVLDQLVERLLLHSPSKYNNFVQVRQAMDSRAPLSTFADYDPDLCPVFYPIFCGLLRVTKRFIQANPHWANGEMRHVGTPLMIAVERDDSRMIVLLIKELQADKNKSCALRLWARINPIYYAAYLGYEKAFQALIRCDAAVDIRAKYSGDGEDTSGSGTPILHTAAYWGRTKILEALLDLPGMHVDQLDEDGATPLFSAVAGRHLNEVRLLVEHGCDMAARSTSGKTAVHCALELRDESTIQYFITQIEKGPPFPRTFHRHDLEWARKASWFPRALKAFPQGESRAEEPYPLALSDVPRLFWVLEEQLKLSRQLSIKILDLAEYWTAKLVRRSDSITVTARSAVEAYVSVKAHGPVRRVTFRTVSHDQGWASEEPKLNGGYAGSFTFFDVGLTQFEGGGSDDSQERHIRHKRFMIQRNVRACGSSRTHLNDFDIRNESLTGDMQRWLAAIRPGDEIGIYPRAQYPGWTNHVHAVEIKLWCAIE